VEGGSWLLNVPVFRQCHAFPSQTISLIAQFMYLGDMIFGGGFLFFKFKKYQKLLILHDILLVVHKPLTCLDWQLN